MVFHQKVLKQADHTNVGELTQQGHFLGTQGEARGGGRRGECSSLVNVVICTQGICKSTCYPVSIDLRIFIACSIAEQQVKGAYYSKPRELSIPIMIFIVTSMHHEYTYMTPLMLSKQSEC